MAPSPWHLARTFTCEEAAALLAGYAEVQPYQESWLKVDTALLGQWVERMIEAAHRRELELLEIKATTVDPRSRDSTKMKGVPFDRPVSMEDMAHEKLRDVIFKIERGELYRWLRASGIEDYDIPAVLHVMPAERQRQSEELHPRREATYQRIIATLLAVQYGANELEEPFRLADQVLDDCQAQDVKAPASRNTLGELIKQLPRVQKAPLD